MINRIGDRGRHRPKALEGGSLIRQSSRRPVELSAAVHLRTESQGPPPSSGARERLREARPMTARPVQHGAGVELARCPVFSKRRQCIALELTAEVASSRRNSASFPPITNLYEPSDYRPAYTEDRNGSSPSTRRSRFQIDSAGRDRVEAVPGVSTVGSTGRASGRAYSSRTLPHQGQGALWRETDAV